MALTVGAAATFTTENSGTFYTATVATSGSNRGLLVFVATTSQATPHNITYNGVTMTQEVTAQEPDTGKRIAIWSLVGPATGSNTLALSLSAAAAMAMTALPLVDVDQTDFVTNTRNVTGSSITAGVTGFTSTATEVVFDALSWSGTTGTLTAGSQQTQISNIVSGGTSIRNATSYESGSAAVASTWSLGAVTNWIAAAVSCKSVSADPISQGPTNSQVSLFAITNAQTDNSGTTYTLAVECSGTARAMVVMVANSSQSLPHGMRYSATALTREGFTQEVPSGKYISIWSLIAPAAGSNTLTISFSVAAAVAVTVFSLANVDQFDMVGGYTGATASNTTPALSVSAQAGELILDGLCFDGGVASPTGTEQSMRSQHGNSGAMIGTSSKPAGGADNIASWSLSLADDWAYGAVNVKPFVAKAGKAARAHLCVALTGYSEFLARDFYTFIQQPLAADVSASASSGPVVGNTGSIGPRVSLPPQYLADDAQWKRQASTWMHEVNQGHLANTGVVTLAAGTASTVVQDDRVGEHSFIGLMARTANAAAEAASGNLYVLSGKKTFTIAHTNNAQTDRTFTYNISG